jgi:hypothetical protein
MQMWFESIGTDDPHQYWMLWKELKSSLWYGVYPSAEFQIFFNQYHTTTQYHRRHPGCHEVLWIIQSTLQALNVYEAS